LLFQTRRSPRFNKHYSKLKRRLAIWIQVSILTRRQLRNQVRLEIRLTSLKICLLCSQQHRLVLFKVDLDKRLWISKRQPHLSQRNNRQHSTELQHQLLSALILASHNQIQMGSHSHNNRHFKPQFLQRQLLMRSNPKHKLLLHRFKLLLSLKLQQLLSFQQILTNFNQQHHNFSSLDNNNNRKLPNLTCLRSGKQHNFKLLVNSLRCQIFLLNLLYRLNSQEQPHNCHNSLSRGSQALQPNGLNKI